MKAIISLVLGSMMLNLSAHATAGSPSKTSTPSQTSDQDLEDAKRSPTQAQRMEERPEGYSAKRARKMGLEKTPLPYIRQNKRK